MSAATSSTPSLTWYDIRDFGNPGVEGKAWTDTKEFFDRLPARAETMVPEAVWNLSRSATGMSFQFETDAVNIHARWQLKGEMINERNFPAAGFSGLDLYADDFGTWRWVGAGHLVENRNPEQSLGADLTPGYRRYLCYLPLRNPVAGVSIGVPTGSTFKPILPRQAKPVVWYGTSIVHGAYASHAGMVHASILSRRLKVPMHNLGFSGNGRMEPVLAELLGEIDARCYILDCLPNMSVEQVEERLIPFVKHLARVRPGVPVVLVEDRGHTNSWIRPALKREHEMRWQAHRKAFLQLRDDGFAHVTSVDGPTLWGSDNETSLDGSHPSDLGYMRQAEVMEPILRRVLGIGGGLDVPDARSRTVQTSPAKEQLRMIWPQDRLSSPPPINLPTGYVLRQFKDSDKPGYKALMIKAGFSDWSDTRTEDNLKAVLPDAFFVIEHQASGKIVATAVATHHSLAGLPASGELGWVAGDPEHNGKGLGFAVCSAVVGRFLEMGYRNIYLRTDDFRLPAIKVYLKMGFQPLLFCAGMDERWQAICETLKWR